MKKRNGESKMVCPKCGREISDSGKYCEVCGEKILDTEVESKPVDSSVDKDSVKSQSKANLQLLWVAMVVLLIIAAMGLSGAIYNNKQMNNKASENKTQTIDTDDYYDHILCSGGGYMLVAKQVETVTEVIEYVGVLDSDYNWVIPLSDDTILNPKGKILKKYTGYSDYDNRCSSVSHRIRYAGNDIFVFGQYTGGYYAAAPDDVDIQAYLGNNAKMIHVEGKKWTWIDIGDYSCAQSIYFSDGYYVAADDGFSADCKTVLIVSAETGGTSTDIYCRGPVWLGQYSEGLFFSYDGFYDIDGNMIIDLTEYAGLIKNQPYFQNGLCTLIAYNEIGTKYIGEIDMNGSFISEFMEVE